MLPVCSSAERMPDLAATSRILAWRRIFRARNSVHTFTALHNTALHAALPCIAPGRHLVQLPVGVVRGGGSRVGQGGQPVREQHQHQRLVLGVREAILQPVAGSEKRPASCSDGGTGSGSWLAVCLFVSLNITFVCFPNLTLGANNTRVYSHLYRCE